MHHSFDIYPPFLKRFRGPYEPARSCALRFEIVSVRGYKYETINGKRTAIPQTAREGHLAISRRGPVEAGQPATLQVEHNREWGTWGGQKPASRQVIRAEINYQADTLGSLRHWQMEYRSEPIAPVKSFKHTPIPAWEKKGRVEGEMVDISSGGSIAPARYRLKATPTCLYTLIDVIQCGFVGEAKMDYVDDLSMFRPGLELVALGESRVEVEGEAVPVTGYGLVGPALLPHYLWMDAHGRILAIIGHNTAYTLMEA